MIATLTTEQKNLWQELFGPRFDLASLSPVRK